jgi:hypothetical protein
MKRADGGRWRVDDGTPEATPAPAQAKRRFRWFRRRRAPAEVTEA